MKLSEWTDAQCSRWIANNLEPKPRSNPHDGCLHGRYKFWLCADHQTGKLEARDMVNDPAMTVMLWEKMIDDEDFEGASARIQAQSGYSNGCAGEDWPRLVVEAWMLANGWTEDRTLSFRRP